MTKRILAICDPDQNFITAFTKRVSRRNTAGLEIRAFTDTKTLLEYARTEPVDLFLISETILNEELSNICKEKLLVLSEHETPGPDPENCCRSICKYRSASELMRQILEFFSAAGNDSAKKEDGENAARETEDEPAGSGFFYKPKTEMIGVFSPVARCGKSSFALSLAQYLQTKKPALLLSFDCLSGWKKILHMESNQGGSLADGIYYLRNGNPGIADRLIASTQRIGELSFLPPFDDPVDLIHVTDEEWKVVLDSIRDETGFEAVVADLGMVPVICPLILLNFPKIFMPVGDGISERIKLGEFERYLQKNMLDREMEDRIIKIKIGENADEAYERTIKSDFSGSVPQSDAAFIRERKSFG